jgi:drug/metabolite transporter (DMT)-like permease
VSRGPLTRLLVLGAIWGTSFLFIKVGLEGLPPLGVATARSVAGALTLWAFVAIGRRHLPRDRRLWRHLLLVSLFTNAAPFALFAWGETRVASGIAGIYNATTPLFTLLCAIAFLRAERATAQRALGLLLGFAGIVVVLAPWRGTGHNPALGQLACLVAGASYGVGLVYVRRYVSPYGLDVVVQAAIQVTTGAVVLGVAALAVGGDVHVTAKVAGAMASLGILGTGVAYVLYNGLIRDVGATSTSLVTFVVPCIAVMLGIAVYDEPLTWNVLAGAAVVVLGVATAEGRLRRGARPAAA